MFPIQKLISFSLLAFVFGNSLFHIFKKQLGPVAINSQLAAATLIIVLATVIFLQPTTNGNAAQRKNRYSWKIVVFYVIYTIVAFTSIIFGDGVLSVHFLGLGFTLIFLLALFFLLSKANKTTIVSVFKLLLLLASCQALLGIAQFVFNHPIVPKDHMGLWRYSEINRASGTYRDPFDFAFYLAISYVCVRKNTVLRLPKRSKILFIILLIIAISFSQSFTVITALIIYEIYLLTVGKVPSRLKNMIIVFVLASFSIGIYGTVFSNSKFGSMLNNRLSQYSNVQNEGDARSLHLRIGWRMMEDTNYFGAGYGNYDRLSPSYLTENSYIELKYRVILRRMTVPTMISHSLPGTVAGELGLLGILAFGLLCFGIARPIWRLGSIEKRSGFSEVYTGIVVLVLVSFMTYGFRLSNAFLFFVLFIFLEVLWRSRREVD